MVPMEWSLVLQGQCHEIFDHRVLHNSNPSGSVIHMLIAEVYGLEITEKFACAKKYIAESEQFLS